MWTALGLLGAAGLGMTSSLITGANALSSQKDLTREQIAESQRQFDANLAWQREQLKSQQSFYERLSNTAHQREMADLLAAGLNPILTATGGSGASSASAPSPSGLSPNLPNLPDPAAAWSSMQRGISDALDQTSLAALRFSQSAESLAKADQTKGLTPFLQRKLDSEVGTATAMVAKLNAEAESLMKLTPAKANYLDGLAKYFSHRQWNDWFNSGVNAARTLSSEIRYWTGRGFDLGGRSGGFLERQNSFPPPSNNIPIYKSSSDIPMNNMNPLLFD